MKRNNNIPVAANEFSSSGIKELLLAGIVLLILLSIPQLSTAEQVGISGFTEPAQDSALGLSITGRTIAIKVTEGETVKQGQLLLQLDQELEQLEVKRRKLLWESKVEIESVKLQVKTLQNHLQSTRDLYQSTGSIPREELENKELELAFVVAELNRLKIAEQREKIEYNTARQQLAKRNLYAPFAGQVTEIMIGIGENCDIDTPLLRLIDNSRGYFVANLEQEIVTNISLGQQVQLQLQTGGEPVTSEATIVFISPLVDSASGLRKIKAEFDNQEQQIIPGVAGTMQLPEQ
ncbi:MAG: efflux RND transporter periplasmic adaptor subunit [Desulfuromusa sp.]|nr:efflux RND transporter periplasmic adaptor subunit [Desulfuromusa sp.]